MRVWDEGGVVDGDLVEGAVELVGPGCVGVVGGADGQLGGGVGGVAAGGAGGQDAVDVQLDGGSVVSADQVRPAVQCHRCSGDAVPAAVEGLEEPAGAVGAEPEAGAGASTCAVVAADHRPPAARHGGGSGPGLDGELSGVESRVVRDAHVVVDAVESDRRVGVAVERAGLVQSGSVRVRPVPAPDAVGGDLACRLPQPPVPGRGCRRGRRPCSSARRCSGP